MHSQDQLQAGETEAGNAGVRPARDNRPGLRRTVEEADQTLRLQSPASSEHSPMPQKTQHQNTASARLCERLELLFTLNHYKKTSRRSGLPSRSQWANDTTANLASSMAVNVYRASQFFGLGRARSLARINSTLH